MRSPEGDYKPHTPQPLEKALRKFVTKFFFVANWGCVHLCLSGDREARHSTRGRGGGGRTILLQVPSSLQPAIWRRPVVCERERERMCVYVTPNHTTTQVHVACRIQLDTDDKMNTHNTHTHTEQCTHILSYTARH